MDFKQALFLWIHKVIHMAEGKTIGAWLSGSDLEKAEARAKKIAAGNNSAYVKALIIADLNGSGPDLSEGTDVILKLAQHYHPTLANTLAQQLQHGGTGKGGPVNQARVISQFLEGLNRALEGSFDPEKQFELADRAQVTTWETMSESHMDTLAAALATHLKIGQTVGEKYPSRKKPGAHQPPNGRKLAREATSKHPASSSKSKAS